MLRKILTKYFQIVAISNLNYLTSNSKAALKAYMIYLKY